MNVEKMTAVIRLRTAWEAIDLGVCLARQWYLPLVTIWLMLALPVFILVALLPIEVMYAALIFWWLKPIYEKPMMQYVSRALFGEFTPLKTIHQSLWTINKANLLRELTQWRLSMMRSFTMSVSLLEGLRKSDRVSRLAVLQQRQQGAAQWLTIVCLHLEMIIYLSLYTIIYFFIPSGWVEGDMLSLLTEPPQWLSYVVYLCYFIAVGMVAPFFVAAGFSLYIMRRTQLEGWDIELQFKQLASEHLARSEPVGKQPHKGSPMNDSQPAHEVTDV